IDATNPDAPILLSSITIPDTTIKVILQDNLLYALSDQSGLFIYDITNPTSPTLLDNHIVYHARDLFLKDDLAYIVNTISASSSLFILDIADPQNIVQLQHIANAPNNSSEIQVLDGFVIAAAAASLTQQAFVNNNFVFNTGSGISYYYEGQTVNQFVLDLPFVYFTITNGLEILKLPLNNIDLGFAITDGYANSISVSNDLAVVGDGSNGVVLLDIS